MLNGLIRILKMCKWGTHELMKIKIPANLSSTGKDKIKTVGIDKCIAHIIKALQDAGIETTGCCCGHGESDGYIGLNEGLILTIKKWERDFNKIKEHMDD